MPDCRNISVLPRDADMHAYIHRYKYLQARFILARTAAGIGHRTYVSEGGQTSPEAASSAERSSHWGGR